MAFRLPGSGPVYEPFWITKYGVVKEGESVKRGDIVATTPTGVESATNDAVLTSTGYGQALEDANAGDTIQIAIAGSAIRGLCAGLLQSGNRVKLVVGNAGKQTFGKAAAADIAAGKSFATFLHVEASPLSTPSGADSIGVFILG